MSPRSTLARMAAATALLMAGSAQAGVVEGADVGGFRTFVDTNTGTVWADLDNQLTFTGIGFAFRFADFGDYMNALTAAGFSWATSAQVAALTASLPLGTTTEFDALGSVMGSLSFGETTSLDAYADAGAGEARRHYGAPDYAGGTASWALTPTGGVLPTSLNDAGLWAYVAGPAGGGSVPLPGTLVLAGLGLCVVAGRSQRLQRP
jgi:hypothetical protein